MYNYTAFAGENQIYLFQKYSSKPHELRVIKIISPLLKQYAHKAPEPACAIFSQYYTEEERGRFPMETHPSVFENEPFYQATEDQARPDVVYTEIHG